jgi:ABC-type polysaccharide/polyol phosphate export permease
MRRKLEFILRLSYDAALSERQGFKAENCWNPVAEAVAVMLQYDKPTSGIWPLLRFSDLLYHSIVRIVRKNHSNPLMGLISNIMQSVIMVMVFFIMFSILGMRGAAIRGDFLVFLMTGIFLFMTHTKAMGAVFSSEGPASPIMKHAPMTTFLSITSAALASLYLQILSMLVILFVVHVAVRPVIIDDPVGLMLPFFLAWLSGVAIGLIFLSIKPFYPSFAKIASTVYSRANMIASGKMFVAKNLPSFVLPYFAWNPLFHTIDQARDAAFINYNATVTSIMYPIYFSLAVLVIGMMGEFFARQYASLSWYSKR